MIPHLPSSIEAYLKDAGFTSTEIVVIKRLLENESLTVREIAAKTSKSAGLIDQAMKKLMAKKIIMREVVNDQPKYRILSLESISHWLEQDKKSRQLAIERRHKDFEVFLSTVQVDKNRPDMEYFEGEEGICKAYLRLLEQGTEIVGFIPVPFAEEDDPLRTFRLEYFRQRRVNKVFLRQITTDTALARRYQSRDAFEYRQTTLVPDEDLYIPFEKFIVGDIVACIDHLIHRACFIRYPDFAKAEKMAFEKQWSRSKTTTQSAEVVVAQDVATKHPISRKTKILSAVRMVCMSNIVLGVFIATFILSVALTYGLSRYTEQMNLQRVQDKVQSIASTATLDINTKDLAALQMKDDYKKPEWARIVNQLRNIRQHNEHILFVYILRKSPTNPNQLQFQADADSLNPFANTDNDPTNNVDLNGDGKIDEHDELSFPNGPYSTAPAEAFIGFEHATANKNFYTDQWSTMLSGYAPIKDGSGHVVAALGADYSAADFDRLSRVSLWPCIGAGIFLILFVVLRCIALRKPCYFTGFRKSL